MKLKLLAILIALLALSAAPAQAGGKVNSVTFNGFSFIYLSSLANNVNINQFPGDPADYQAPGGPQPPYTEFILYDGLAAPQSGFDGAAAVRVYLASDLANYPDSRAEYDQLQSLLAERADLAPYMVVGANLSENTLPFLPVLPAAQVIRARAQYIDTPSISGISYVTVYGQGPSPFVSSSFIYTFQGLSQDGLYYVTMIASVPMAMFPAEIGADFDMDAFIAGITDYFNESIATLNAATPEQLDRKLSDIDTTIQSMTFVPAS